MRKKRDIDLNEKTLFVPQCCRQQWAETLATIKVHVAILHCGLKKGWGESTELLISSYLFSHHFQEKKLTSHRFYSTGVYLNPPPAHTHTLCFFIYPPLIRTRFTTHKPGMQPVLLQAMCVRGNPCIVNKYLISSKGRKRFIACLLLMLSCAVQSFPWIVWYANMQACLCTNLCSCSLRSLSCS